LPVGSPLKEHAPAPEFWWFSLPNSPPRRGLWFPPMTNRTLRPFPCIT